MKRWQNHLLFAAVTLFLLEQVISFAQESSSSPSMVFSKALAEGKNKLSSESCTESV
jgi:hypothetical protein